MKASAILDTLGHPRQAPRIAHHRSYMRAPMLRGGGAMFDFIARAVRRGGAFVGGLTGCFISEKNRPCQQYATKLYVFS